jgi:hypothetical protein
VSVAVGDFVRVVDSGLREVRAGTVGVVKHLGVKYEGDIRVKFPHDPDLLWLYPEHYERVDSAEIQSR